MGLGICKVHEGNRNFQYVHEQQKEDKESVSLLLGGIRDLVAKNREKAEVLHGTSLPDLYL